MVAIEEQHSPAVGLGEPLTAATAMSVVTVCRVSANHEDGIRLKRMGICEGRQLQLLQDGDPVILRVVGCRIGVSRQLAGQVWVKPCADCPESVRTR